MATIRQYRKKGTRTKQEHYDQINDSKRKTQRIYILNMNKTKNADVIAWLEENKPYQGAIKWLVREQIKREQQEELERLKETSC